MAGRPRMQHDADLVNGQQRQYHQQTLQGTMGTVEIGIAIADIKPCGICFCVSCGHAAPFLSRAILYARAGSVICGNHGRENTISGRPTTPQDKAADDSATRFIAPAACRPAAIGLEFTVPRPPGGYDGRRPADGGDRPGLRAPLRNGNFKHRFLQGILQ